MPPSESGVIKVIGETKSGKSHRLYNALLNAAEAFDHPLIIVPIDDQPVAMKILAYASQTWLEVRISDEERFPILREN
jgi:type II secretory ATPase GspE/PulE/Tfp pilus assembly ATPase PilB-like protein